MDMNFIVKFLLHNSVDATTSGSKGAKSAGPEIFNSEDQIIGQVILHSFALLG